MKELRREIYEVLNDETQGVLLTPDQPLEDAAPRILEALRSMKEATEEAEKRAEQAEAERDDAEAALDDLKEDIKKKVAT